MLRFYPCRTVSRTLTYWPTRLFIYIPFIQLGGETGTTIGKCLTPRKEPITHGSSPRGFTLRIHDGGEGSGCSTELHIANPKKIHEREMLDPKKYLASKFSTPPPANKT